MTDFYNGKDSSLQKFSTMNYEVVVEHYEDGTLDESTSYHVEATNYKEAFKKIVKEYLPEEASDALDEAHLKERKKNKDILSRAFARTREVYIRQNQKYVVLTFHDHVAIEIPMYEAHAVDYYGTIIKIS